MKHGAGLRVVVDGVPLPAEEAVAMWKRFSTHLEDHKGDLAGFAASEGFSSVHPAMEEGRPVLVASRSAPQRPYAPADRGGGGSSDHQVVRRGSPPPKGRNRKGARSR